MIPKRTERNKWTSIDKWKFLAQVLVLVTLFITVFFSHQVWREAKDANRFVFSQLAPQLDITTARFVRTGESTNVWTMTLSNTGESSALKICIRIKGILVGPVYHDTCGDDDSNNRHMSLRKGQSTDMLLLLATDFESEIGFVPTTTMMTPRLGELPDGFAVFLIVRVTYEDVVGTPVEISKTVAFRTGGSKD